MKKRRLEKLTDCSGVFRILLWNDELQQWNVPDSGMRFRAFRNEKDEMGRMRRVSKYFDTLAQAKVYYLKSQYKGRTFEAPKLVS